MNAVYHFGEFRLDSAERRLWCNTEPVPLKPKQFDLLFYFVQNAGQTTRKNELLDAVWSDIYIEESTLARNVSWLRQKLAEYDKSHSFIETVPKIGYRFTAQVTHSDKNIIIEEQTIQHVRGQEIIIIEDTELTKKKEIKSAKTFSFTALIITLAAISVLVGIVFIAYQNQKAEKNATTVLNQATQLNVKATITIKNITVDATREAADVGLRIQPGDVIRVSAMGVLEPEAGQTWTFQGDEKGEISTEHTFQKAAPWSLVAWIGTETDKSDYFQASKNPVFHAEKSGSLYLAINDLVSRYADNRGGLNVSVVLYRQYNIYAEDADVEMAWGKELVKIHEKDKLEIHSRGNVAYWTNGELYDLEGSNHSTEGHLAPEINARSFIGKIGNNSPFKVGKNFTSQQINLDGWLFLSVNDKIFNWANSFKNNSGEITTDVEVLRQPENFKNPI